MLQARARYGWNGPSWGQWFYQPGGGPLFDLGVYNVVALTGLLGPAMRVTAMTATARPDRVVDDQPMRVQTEDSAFLRGVVHGNILTRLKEAKFPNPVGGDSAGGKVGDAADGAGGDVGPLGLVVSVLSGRVEVDLAVPSG